MPWKTSAEALRGEAGPVMVRGHRSSASNARRLFVKAKGNSRATLPGIGDEKIIY